MVPYAAVEKSGSITNLGATTETAIQLPAPGLWLLCAAHFVWSGGSAANFQIHLSGDTGWTAGDITERYTSAATAVGTALHDNLDPRRYVMADADGKVYVQWGFDAGADNDGDYSFIFQKCPGV